MPIANVVSLVVAVVAHFHGLLQYYCWQQTKISTRKYCHNKYYTYSLPSRTARRTQRNITHAMQHSTAHAQTHTQSTYRKISAIIQFKKRTRFPFPCQPRFPVTSSKRSKIDPKTDPKSTENGPHTWTRKHVQNNLQPHTSPLTRIHGVKLPVRLDYSQNEYNRLNSKLNAFRFETACLLNLRSSYLKHTISYNKHMANVQ